MPADELQRGFQDHLARRGCRSAVRFVQQRLAAAEHAVEGPDTNASGSGELLHGGLATIGARETGGAHHGLPGRWRSSTIHGTSLYEMPRLMSRQMCWLDR